MSSPTASRRTTDATPLPVRSAMLFVVLLGIVSLFADMTYEGGRSILGPFLEHLGATATVVGIAAGFGELLGYGLRFLSGYVTDRTGRYWAITITGYVVNLLAVPALALAGRWEVAILLMMLERTGKAIRNPARDAMLSHATHEMGRGWGFGLHEAMDQTGALIGPLVVAFVLHRTGQYSLAFSWLLAPALASIVILLLARSLYPRPHELEVTVPELAPRHAPVGFWWYAAGGAAIAAGYADFTLIAYHFAKHHVVPAALIPVLYAVAMGSAAVSAVLFGRFFDRFGLRAVFVGTLFGIGFAPLAFLGGTRLAVIGVVLWGIGMGVQESAMRAAVAGLVPPHRRAAAYGTFDSVFGVLWFVGSALMGILYDRSIMALVVFSVLAQAVSLPLFVRSRRQAPLPSA